jgi:hypothetical protein
MQVSMAHGFPPKIEEEDDVILAPVIAKLNSSYFAG